MAKGVYERSGMGTKGKYAVGTVHTTSQGEFKILEWVDNKYRLGVFLNTGYMCKVSTPNLGMGKVKNHKLPSVYRVGYLDGIKIPARGDGDVRRAYDLWANMIKRAYTEYADSGVSTEWHSFRTFLNSLPDVPGYEMWLSGEDVHFDKDIRIPGNKLYSLRACSFVTPFENMSDASNRRWGSK